MLELVQLEQLLAIEQYETLSKASEFLHISQPALSRSMQRLEEELHVSLFSRTKNKIVLNDNGLLALDYAKRIIGTCTEMKEHLESFDRSKRTISIGSCAPAPLWSLVPQVSNAFPDMTIQSALKSFEELSAGLADNTYQGIITTQAIHHEDYICRKYFDEHLYISLPPAHPLSMRKSLSLSELNGQSILIYKGIGFWYDICKKKLPDSLFVAQDDVTIYNELRKTSALPSFATNITGVAHNEHNRVFVPLTDSELNVTFYLQYHKTNKKFFDFIQNNE